MEEAAAAVTIGQVELCRFPPRSITGGRDRRDVRVWDKKCEERSEVC